MPKYRWAILKYPDGRKTRVIVEEQEVYADLVTLSRNHGIKYRMGPRCSSDIVIALPAIERQRRLMGRKIAGARLLSPDLGRGSGGPI